MRRQVFVLCLSILINLVLLVNLTGCTKTNFQFTQAKSGTVVQLGINPFPQKSLALNTYTFHVTRNKQPYQGNITIDFQMTNMGMKDSVQATPKGNGTYEVKHELDMSGQWEIIVVIDQANFTFVTQVT